MTTSAQIADLPAASGFRLRRWRGAEADMPLMWAASNAARVADGELERNSLEGMATYYRHLERYDPSTDLMIAETQPDGRFAGYGRVEWNDSNDGERWYEAVCIVDPAFRRRGIGRLLLAWSERRRLEIAIDHADGALATDRTRALTTFIFDGDRGGAVLLDEAGYVPFRRFASMRRPDLADIPDVSMPAGLDIRPVAREPGAMRQVFDADIEAFRDHFGWTEGGDEKFAEFIEDPHLDPGLWLVAFDGEEIAGAILNGIHVSPDGERSGWLDSIFTRRPWRRRGLARALIARSLVLLRDRGLSAASLGVDLTNPNQALGLYESCGFRIVSGATSYRKPLPVDVDHDRNQGVPEEIR
ncbi:MAG: mycothiol synthase [Chloroflexota bacterium]|jgi:ribosomal protein S18 acetylase RimI-like enzyme|nr:mycothiol synthase [Chloroflexota bacterium]